jgi:hypothetical protein
MERGFAVRWDATFAEPACATAAQAAAVLLVNLAQHVDRAGWVAAEQELLVCDQVVRLRFDPVARSLDVTGAPWTAPDAAPAPPDLWAQLGAETQRGPWSPTDLTRLWAGVGALDEAERELLWGATWERHTGNRLDRGMGMVTNRSRPPTLVIAFTDGALSGETWRDALLGGHTLVQETVVHELGHVVSYAPFRQSVLRRRARRHDPSLAPCPETTYLRTPVLEAYERVAAGAVSPTEYGRKDLGEGFAEAFALWKLHPDWLAVAWPDVFTWFEGGGHLAWRTDPAWAACGAGDRPTGP